MKIKSTKESVLLLAKGSYISDYYLIDLLTGEQGDITPERVSELWKYDGAVYETPLPGIGEEITIYYDAIGGRQLLSFLLLPQQKKNRSYSNGVGAPHSNGSFRPNNIRLALDVLH